jgi:5-methylthioadenosine/S-adenosylhomocysteine deaminase
MLRKGYTFFLEPGTAFSPDAVAEGAAAVGVRGSLGDPFLWDVIDGGNALPPMLKDRIACSTDHALKTLGGQLRRNSDPEALIRGHVVIYGSGSQTIELMRAAKAVADRNNVVFNMHHNFTAEQTARDDARLGGGRHAMTAFAEHGLLGANSTFVHMNVIRDDEMALILSSGMSLVWQPGNYMFYGVHDRFRGRMAEVVQRGGRVTFGVDTAKIWTFGDLELIGYLVARQTGGYISTGKIMEMRTVDAAKACGVDHLVGSLEPGKRADVVIRDLAPPETAPGVNPVQELLLGGHAHTVRTVLVDGAVVLMDGAPTRVDAARVQHSGRALARRILSTAGYTPDPGWPQIA